jgi:hypothetical protein
VRRIGPFALAGFLISFGGLPLMGCSRSASNSFKPSTEWQRLDAGPFSISAPPGWRFRPEMGIDSYVGSFRGDGVELTFDFGHFSNRLDDEKKRRYVIEETFVGGARARIVSPRIPGRGLTGIYFQDVGDSRGLLNSNSLTIYCLDLSAQHQKLVLKILHTIQFKPAADTRH